MIDGVLVVNRRIRIPHSEFTFSYVRSSGPGGQNVNKVASKAQLRWDVAASSSLPDAVRARFVAAYGSRITSEGELLLSSQRFRDQRRNTEDCLQKLHEMLAAVAVPPRPRKKTRPTRGSVERRLQGKKQRSDRKQSRQRPNES